MDHVLQLPAPARAGEPEFGETVTSWHASLFFLSYRVHWEVTPGQVRIFDLHVAQTRDDFDDQVAHFRASLWRWLAALAVGLLVMQALVLRIGLAPLPRLAQQLSAIESGERELLSEDQPKELRALVANMNHLIRFGRTSLERHRNALADLAHALKTPLAVLHGAADDMPESKRGSQTTRCTTQSRAWTKPSAIGYAAHRPQAKARWVRPLMFTPLRSGFATRC